MVLMHLVPASVTPISITGFETPGRCDKTQRLALCNNLCQVILIEISSSCPYKIAMHRNHLAPVGQSSFDLNPGSLSSAHAPIRYRYAVIASPDHRAVSISQNHSSPSTPQAARNNAAVLIIARASHVDRLLLDPALVIWATGTSPLPVAVIPFTLSTTCSVCP